MLPGTAQYRVWVGGVGQRLVGGRKACGRIMDERNGGGGPPYLATGKARPHRKGEEVEDEGVANGRQA